MIKKLLFIFLMFYSAALAQDYDFSNARGLFMSFAGGPKIPVGDFSNNQGLGVGFEVGFSYTDDDFIPFFFYTKIGYQHYPGKQTFYENSDYSSFSSNVIFIQSGARYFFPPMIKDVVIVMPVIEGGVSFALFEKLHQFKIDRNKQNFTEEVAKIGFHIGGGVSMFVLDVIGYFNYFEHNQFLSLDLRLRIPIYVNL
jgi:hypothetical protein